MSEYVHEELLFVESIVLEAVKGGASILQRASDVLKKHEKTVLEAVKQTISGSQTASAEQREDREIFVEAFEENVYALKHLF